MTFNPLYSDGLPIVYIMGTENFLNNDVHVFLSMNIVLIVANSADPDEMQHYALFRLGFHYLPKFRLKQFSW